MVVETYGALAGHKRCGAIVISGQPGLVVLADLYGKLNLNLEPTPQPSSSDASSVTIRGFQNMFMSVLLYRFGIIK